MKLFFDTTDLSVRDDEKTSSHSTIGPATHSSAGWYRNCERSENPLRRRRGAVRVCNLCEGNENSNIIGDRTTIDVIDRRSENKYIVDVLNGVVEIRDINKTARVRKNFRKRRSMGHVIVMGVYVFPRTDLQTTYGGSRVVCIDVLRNTI